MSGAVDPWCVIGAGPSGLAALKHLLALGIPALALEREDDVGGNWYFGSGASAVFESTRLISSKTMTGFLDFPMPRAWPHYPDHRRCLAYLRAYADRFGLRPFIRTSTPVERAERLPGGGWSVRTAAGTTRCAGLVVATGHNRRPRLPDLPGTFTGTLLHACDYRSPTVPVALAGKRVLVVGGGNSGCDIAVEASRHAARTVHSTRRGYHVVPRMVMGRPSDLRGERLLRMGLPTWLRRLVALRMIDRTIGLPWRYGLPRPDHRLWETHPVINSDLPARIRAGAIEPRGDVRAFDGAAVDFADGSSEPFDVVILATGYRLDLPFLGTGHLAEEEGVPRLYLNMLHPQRDDVAVCGLIQPDSGQWGLTDLQGSVVARMALAARASPRALAFLHRERTRGGDGIPRPAGIRYLESPRHRFEVEHFSYRKRLEALRAALDRRLRRDGALRTGSGARRPPPGDGVRGS